MVKLSKEQVRIYRGEICPYCGKHSEYVDSQIVYGVSHGMIYICRPCNAYVGVHKGTDRAKGRLADKGLRNQKIEAHKYFDLIWKDKIMSRPSAYKMLAKQLNIPVQYTHIGMFGLKTCKSVVSIAKNILKSHGYNV